MQAESDNEKFEDARSVNFGMRKLEIHGPRFVLNGRPIFLRGTLECAVFPLTGYPPTDAPAWRRIFRVLKSYGLNFMRFHSWCPPEAAFAAADVEGVYLQVEGPEANITIDRHAPIGRFMEQELLRIVRVYGNHPSFCLMTLGNEHQGVGDTLDYWVQMLIREDPRHFYSSASEGQRTAHRQYTEGGSRGVQGPRTDADFRFDAVRQEQPLMGHEIGQWTFFPNFDEIAKYTGVFRAKNFELVRDDLAPRACSTSPRGSSRPPAATPCCCTRKRSRFCSAHPTVRAFRSSICTIIPPKAPRWSGRSILSGIRRALSRRNSTAAIAGRPCRCCD